MSVCCIYAQLFKDSRQGAMTPGRGGGGGSKRQDVGSSANASNAIAATSASSRGKEKKKVGGVSSSLGKRGRKTEPEEELLIEGQEGAYTTPRQGEGGHQDAVATESTPDQSDGKIDDENQNKSAYFARFSKRSQASKRNELIHDTMPCKDALSPDLDVFMSTTRQPKLVESCHESRSCTVERALQDSETYGLTLLEIASPRMNAEGQPVERLDVWLMNAATRSDIVIYHFDCTDYENLYICFKFEI